MDICENQMLVCT